MSPLEMARILHACVFDVGGAANAALSLNSGLAKLGLDSKLLCGKKSVDDPNVMATTGILPDLAFRHFPRIQYYTGKLRALGSGVFFPAYTLGGYGLKDILTYDPDVLNMHNIYWGFLTAESLKKIRCPMVWTLHDLAAISGGFGFRSAAGIDDMNSKAMTFENEVRELSENYLAWKTERLRPLNITAVAPSKWLAAEARRSPIFEGKRVECIPYGVDSDLFRPGGREEIRAELGLGSDEFVVLFGADGSNEKRKGGHILKRALEIMMRRKTDRAITVAYFGGENEALEGISGIRSLSLGRITNRKRMAEIYQAGDVFICPSLEDNFPNTVLESLASGVPVIGSEVGGIPDMVVEGESGWTYSSLDPEALASRLIEASQNPENLMRLRASSRARVERNYTLGIQAKAYADLYGELLAVPR